MLTIETVTCGYGRGARPVLQDLSLSFRPGVMTALVGPNGCGKSTLLKAIMGFLALEAGSIT
ncbi:MAG: ABC transporter ATP-binding protein, partial [Pseudomonadota bacterium]